MSEFLANHCDGSGPHWGNKPEVRLYPLGGGANLILCQRCAGKENIFRAERGRETGAPENWPVLDWNTLKIYATEDN